MKMASIQPEVLAANLQAASIPDEPTPAPAKTGGGVMAFLGLKPQAAPLVPATRKRVGIPHGVDGVRIHAKRIHVNKETKQVAYCNSFGYEALGTVPIGDDEPYPQMATTNVTCNVPRTGYYNATLVVSVNGAIAVDIQELQPVNA